MEEKKKRLEAKMVDYRQFFIVLLLIGCYVYFGAYNDIYIHPNHDGLALLLFSLGFLFASGFYLKSSLKLKKKLEKNEL